MMGITAKINVFITIFSIFSMCFSQKARVVIDGQVDLKPLSDSIEIVVLKDGDTAPAGYIGVARGKFKTGPATIKCGERLMMKMMSDKAREIGATAFSLYNVREPDNVFSTCYRANVLFLRRE